MGRYLRRGGSAEERKRSKKEKTPAVLEEVESLIRTCLPVSLSLVSVSQTHERRRRKIPSDPQGASCNSSFSSPSLHNPSLFFSSSRALCLSTPPMARFPLRLAAVTVSVCGDGGGGACGRVCARERVTVHVTERGACVCVAVAVCSALSAEGRRGSASTSLLLLSFSLSLPRSLAHSLSLHPTVFFMKLWEWPALPLEARECVYGVE